MAAPSVERLVSPPVDVSRFPQHRPRHARLLLEWPEWRERPPDAAAAAVRAPAALASSAAAGSASSDALPRYASECAEARGGQARLVLCVGAAADSGAADTEAAAPAGAAGSSASSSDSTATGSTSACTSGADGAASITGRSAASDTADGSWASTDTTASGAAVALQRTPPPNRRSPGAGVTAAGRCVFTRRGGGSIGAAGFCGSGSLGRASASCRSWARGFRRRCRPSAG